MAAASDKRSLVVLVQPTGFFANPSTLADNYFQQDTAGASSAADADKSAGIRELEALHKALEAKGVQVRRIELTSGEGGDAKPDAIFPNNSFSLHTTPDGAALHSVMWPMSPGRVDEIPLKIRQALMTATKVIDLRHVQDMPGIGSTAADGAARQHPIALEGTGALVFSQDGTACFVARSQRADDGVLRLLSSLPAAEPFRRPVLEEVHVFDGVDAHGRPVYHTNVLGWCGTRAAGWCLDGMKFAATEAPATDDGAPHTAVRFISSSDAFRAWFAQRGVRLVELSFDELHNFAGNCLELFDGEGRPLLTISATAWTALRPETRAALEAAYGEGQVLVAQVPTIERLGGGSVRCLQAHLNYAAPAADAAAAFLRALE